MCADIQTGQDAVISAAFADADGPVTGVAANFTVAVTNRVDGTSITPGAVAENPAGSGRYEATLAGADLSGRMRLAVVWDNPTDALYAEYFLAVGDVPPWARTRRELRYRIATRLWGEEKVWQERAAGGTDTTAVLDGLVVGGDGEFRGLYAWFGSGANRHLTRRVTDFDAATTTLTWAPALPAAIAANDWVEVYPVRPGRLNDAIGDAIAELRGHHLVEVDEQVLVTDGTTTEWLLPSDAAYVANVGRVEETDGTFAGWYMPADWSLLPNRRLRLHPSGSERGLDPMAWGTGWPVAVPAGSRLRLHLLCDLDPPTSDDSLVDAPPAAVVDLACFLLTMSEPSLRPLLPFYAARAERARGLARTALPPGTREVLA